MRYAWEECGVIPRFYLEHAIRTEDLARAVLRGEVNAMAIDVRGEGFSAIAQIRREVPEMTVGACGIVSSEETAAAVRAGAWPARRPRGSVSTKPALGEGCSPLPSALVSLVSRYAPSARILPPVGMR